MKIEKNRTYVTVSGLDVRIYSTDNAHGCVHGAIEFNGGWHPQIWTDAGEALANNHERMTAKLDLVLLPDIRYVVTYPDDFVDAEVIFMTLQEAKLFGEEVGDHSIYCYEKRDYNGSL